MIAEGLLPELPLMFQTGGIESHVTNLQPIQKFNRHGLPNQLSTPEKIDSDLSQGLDVPGVHYIDRRP